MTMVPIAIGEALTGVPFDQMGPVAGTSEGLGSTKVPFRRLRATVVYEGRTFAHAVAVGPVPRMVVGQSDFMTAFDVRFYWGHTPKVFHVDPTQPGGRKPSPKRASTGGKRR